MLIVICKSFSFIKNLLNFDVFDVEIKTFTSDKKSFIDNHDCDV